MIITPNTDLITEAANPVTAARFPSCKHFWQCKETSGTSLADAMGTCDLTGASSMTFGTSTALDSAGVSFVKPTVVAGTGTVDGTIHSIGTSPFLFLQVAKATTTGVVVGDASTQDAISLARAGTTAVVDGAATADATAAAFTTADSTIMVRALVVKDFAGNLANFSWNCETNAAVTDHGDAATTNSSNLSSGMTVWGCPTTVAELYGVALFTFGTIPSDTEIAGIIAWCGYYWPRGYKTLPPWLVGRS